MKVFLDTNVLASGLATRGLCSDVVRTVLERHDLVISEQLVGELKRVLRDRFDVPEDVAVDAVWTLRQDAICGDEAPLVDVSLKDQDDIPLLSAAHNARADYFVTGDAEVRNLAHVGSMKIVSPRQFWEAIRR